MITQPSSAPVEETAVTAARGLAGRVAKSFINSKLTPLIVITAVLLGVAAIVLLPREEEPQIKVPMIDVLVDMPGFTAKEVEERATRPMEKLLWEIPGVEYIYSTSRDGESLVIVRFKVGEDLEEKPGQADRKAALELRPHPARRRRAADQAQVHRRRADSGADVSQRALRSSHPAPAGGAGGRRGESRCRSSRRRRSSAARGGKCACCSIRCGWPRAISARPDSCRCCSRPTGNIAAGGLTTNNQEVMIETGAFLTSAEDVGNVVVGVFGGRPVYLREVAEIMDGAEEPSNYVFFGHGAARRFSAG